MLRRAMPSGRSPDDPARAPLAERPSRGSKEWVRGPGGDRGCCCGSCNAKAEEGMGLGICVNSGYCAGGRTRPEGLHISAMGGCSVCGGSASGPPISTSCAGDCMGTGSGRFLMESSRSRPASGLACCGLRLLGWPASACSEAAGAGSLRGGLDGPGGLAARMSRTESAICLLARLTFSPRLCLDWMLLRPKDASLRGSELSGRELSGCQSMAGVSLSCQEGTPCKPWTFHASPGTLAGCCATELNGCAAPAKIEGGMLTPVMSVCLRLPPDSMCLLQRHRAQM